MHIKELFANLVAEAKRLPWWAWLLIAAAVYLGYRLVTGGSSSQDSSGDPLANVLDTTGPSSSSDTVSSEPSTLNELPTLSGFPLPDLTGDHGDDGTVSAGDNGVITTPARVIAQGHDIHDQSRIIAQQQALQQTLNQNEANGQQATIAAQQQAAAQQRAYLNAASPVDESQIAKNIQPAPKPATYKPAPPRPNPFAYAGTSSKYAVTGRNVHVDPSSGLGGGPDTHGKGPPVYRMRRGEDLYSVSERLGVPADDLYAANRDRIDAAIREAGLTGMGVYALPAIGDGLELIIPASAL